MSPGRFARLPVAAAVGTALAVALPASAGQDSPKPCRVSYAANAAHPGGTLATGFYVACTADSTSDLTSIELSTDIADVRDRAVDQHCGITEPGTSASDPCSLSGVKRGHVYSVTFRLTAHGNVLSCADDGTCSPYNTLLSPGCATDPRTAQRIAGSATDPVVTCTYQRLVAVAA